MYESYFHPREKPSDIVPNPAYLYLSTTHKQAMTCFKYGLQERLGFVLITDEAGSGKKEDCAALKQRAVDLESQVMRSTAGQRPV